MGTGTLDLAHYANLGAYSNRKCKNFNLEKDEIITISKAPTIKLYFRLTWN